MRAQSSGSRKSQFIRFDQMYSNQIHWLRDVLEHGLFLASNDSLSPSRDSFGRNIFVISERIQNGPMHAVARKISAYGERWNQSPFLFSLLAVWTTSRQYKLGIVDLDELEGYLRNARNVLEENDFR